MTVSVTTTRGVFTGDGTTLIFPFAVPLLQAADLTVYVNSILQVQGSQYTISPTGGAYPCTSGNIIFTNGNAPVNLGAGIYIRVTPLTQTIALPVEGNISSPTLSTVFDKATMGLQQLQEEINRSITIPVTAPSGISTALSLPVASALITWDPTATFLQNSTIQQVLANAGITFTSTTGQVLGPSPTTPHTVVLWNNTIGTSVKDGPSLGPSGSVLTSNGGSADPSFQFPFPFTMQGRLSLSSTLPVSVGDITGATSVNLLPYLGSFITLWDSTHSRIIFNRIPQAGVNIPLTGLPTGVYDIFVSDPTGSGTTTGSLVAWTNNTTRATSLVYGTNLQALTLNGDQTKAYLGSIFLTGTGVSEDTAADRALFNYYNRVRRTLQANITTSSWAYTGSTWRASNANTTNGQGRFSFLNGMQEETLNAMFNDSVRPGNSSAVSGIGIAVNSTTIPANSCEVFPNGSGGGAQDMYACSVGLMQIPPLGYNFVQALENADGNFGCTFFGFTTPSTAIGTGIFNLTGSINQ